MGKQLPKGWVETELVNIVDILDNKRKPVSAKIRASRQGDIPYYGATGVAGNIDDYIFDEELVLLGEDGAPFFDRNKNVAFIISGKSWVNNHAHVLRACNITSNKFVETYLNQFNYEGFVGGTTRLKLNQGNLKSIPFPLPPRAEQDRIVAKVDALMEQHAAIQQAMERIPQLLKDFRQQILTQAVTGKLTEEWRIGKELGKVDLDIVGKERVEKNIKVKSNDKLSKIIRWFKSPQDWKWAKMEKVCLKITDGAHNTPKILANGFPFLMAKDLSNGFLDFSQHKFISEKDHRELYNKCLPDIGDLLIVNIGAGSGNNVIINDDFEFSFKNIAILKKSKLLEPYFLKIYFDVRKEEIFRTKTRGGAQPFLSLSVLKDIDIVLPPLEEQQEIGRRVERLFEKATAIEQCYEQLKSQINTLPQAILHKAFKGELVEQLDSDGSAMELLKEIEGMRSLSKKKR